MTRPAAERARTGNRLPVSPRDRRPALAALVAYRSGQRTDVLVAAHEIKPGQRVTASDFDTARVAADSASIVHASSKSAFVGSYAVTDIPSGTIINNSMFQAGKVLPANGVVVGVVVANGNAPAGSIPSGTVVRAYYVPQSSSSSQQAGTVLANAARVVEVKTSETSSNSQTVSLLVSSDEAADLVSASAAGDVALALLPLGTKPDVDFQRAS